MTEKTMEDKGPGAAAEKEWLPEYEDSRKSGDVTRS